MHTQTRRLATLVVAVVALGLGGAYAPAEKEKPPSTVEQIRKELIQLPYYGVFDFIAFGYNDATGTVTLNGYGYRTTLREDAERAVKRVAAVKNVMDDIQVLPASRMDDQLRWGGLLQNLPGSVPVALRAWRGHAFWAPTSDRRCEPADKPRSPAVSRQRAESRLPDSYHRQWRTHHTAGCGGHPERQDAGRTSRRRDSGLV